MALLTLQQEVIYELISYNYYNYSTNIYILDRVSARQQNETVGLDNRHPAVRVGIKIRGYPATRERYRLSGGCSDIRTGRRGAFRTGAINRSKCRHF